MGINIRCGVTEPVYVLVRHGVLEWILAAQDAALLWSKKLIV